MQHKTATEQQKESEVIEKLVTRTFLTMILFQNTPIKI